VRGAIRTRWKRFGLFFGKTINARTVTSPHHRHPTHVHAILRLADIDTAPVEALLAHYGLTVAYVGDGAAIPGSFWGDEEAGIIGNTVYARSDTPVHSLLHEAGHLIVLPPERRQDVHTDATDSIAEEDAVCYLQIVLADRLPGVGRRRIMSDMDAWGYSFRLGSANAWFEHDADNARDWLIARGLLTLGGEPV
jgi:hypothetical protein